MQNNPQKAGRFASSSLHSVSSTDWGGERGDIWKQKKKKSREQQKKKEKELYWMFGQNCNHAKKKSWNRRKFKQKRVLYEERGGAGVRGRITLGLW